MYIEKFLATHPIFTTEELREFAFKTLVKPPSNSTLYNLLQHHEKRGHILQIRRGLYYTLPREAIESKFPVDPFLVASKLTSDSLIAFHSALWMHQVAYSASNIIYYLTEQITRPRLQFQGKLYFPVYPSSQLPDDKKRVGVTTVNREGVKVQVTTLERTIVDVLHRPLLGGGLEEVWQSLEGITYLNIDQVVEYALLLNHHVTAAKVGFFLETHQEKLRVSASHIEQLRKARSKTAQYFFRDSEKPQKLIGDWNLIVPGYLLKDRLEGYDVDF